MMTRKGTEIETRRRRGTKKKTEIERETEEGMNIAKTANANPLVIARTNPTATTMM